MSEAKGLSLYITPIERNGDQWTGSISDMGAVALEHSSYTICNLVIYNDEDIIDSPIFEGERVHNVFFENTIKIEGVY